jgi:folate-binding protein YgfZ
MQLDFALPAGHLATLLRGATMVVEDPAVFQIEGPGALACLQGLLTNDLISPGENSLVYGALLTPKGMIVVDPWVIRESAGFTLLASRSAHPATAELLHRSLPPRLARVTDLTGQRRLAWLLGAAAAERLARASGGAVPGPGNVIRLPDHGGLLLAGGTPHAPFRVMALGTMQEIEDLGTRFEHAGGQRSGDADLAAARVLGGWPTLGREIDERTLPQEVRYDELGGVSYTKGCYTGQETVARIHFRGHVNKTLRGLLFEGEAPLQERTLTIGEKEVGVIRTAIAADGHLFTLGTVRRELDPAITLHAGGREGRLINLPVDPALAGVGP